jgi:hypothetical protein
MKLKLAFVISALAMASNSNAAVYYVTNISSGYAYSDALFQNTNDSLLDGGIVAFGVFTGTGFDANNIATSISNFTILASALTGTDSTTLGGAFPGYADTSIDTANIEGSNPLISQSLFVFVGNASTLAASTAFGLFQTATIQSDIPNEQTYLANPLSAINSSSLLMGEEGSITYNPNNALSTAEETFKTLKLTAPVPEPSAALLGGLGALAACVRRRRN